MRRTRFIAGLSRAITVYGSNDKGIGSFAKVKKENLANFMLDAVVKDEWDGTWPAISESTSLSCVSLVCRDASPTIHHSRERLIGQSRGITWLRTY